MPHPSFATMVMALALSAGLAAPARAEKAKTTIVLVHGAFAESSTWDAVLSKLDTDGFVAIAAANPLRSLSGDAASVGAIVQSINGPVVLVGHSYGGTVITEAASGAANVKALVYVAGFAPDIGESSLSLASKFPGSTLPAAIKPIAMAGGGQDLLIDPDKFHAQFAADVSDGAARLMAATQKPVTQAALAEPARSAAWRTIPSYAIYGLEDRNIPAAAVRFMAERARGVRVVAIEGASHALMVSHPAEVAALIEEAASAP